MEIKYCIFSSWSDITYQWVTSKPCKIWIFEIYQALVRIIIWVNINLLYLKSILKIILGTIKRGKFFFVLSEIILYLEAVTQSLSEDLWQFMYLFMWVQPIGKNSSKWQKLILQVIMKLPQQYQFWLQRIKNLDHHLQLCNS